MVDVIIYNQFGSYITYPVKALGFNRDLILGDFNNDSKPDITTSYDGLYESDVCILYNNTLKISPSTTQYRCIGDNFYIKKYGTYPGFYWSPSNSTADSILISTSGFYAGNVPGAIGSCSCSVGINAYFSPTPTLSISGNNPICPGSTTTLTAFGANSYTWNPGPASTTISISPTVNTTYTITGDINGCKGQSVYTESVYPLPILNPSTSNTLICAGQSSTLSVSGANSYTWNPGGAGASIPVSPTVTTIYTVTGTDVNNCTNSSTITQSVSACTGITGQIIVNEFFSVYPNPNNGSFKLSADFEIQNGELILFNAIGQKVFSQKIKQGENEIKTHGLAKGLYNYSVLQNRTLLQNGKIVIE